MCRLTDRTVRSALVTAWRLATSPTSTSSDLDHATTEGVVRAPSALEMTVASPPSMTETTELVVPRSMPTALAICGLLCERRVAVSGARRPRDGDRRVRRPSGAAVTPYGTPHIADSNPSEAARSR